MERGKSVSRNRCVSGPRQHIGRKSSVAGMVMFVKRTFRRVSSVWRRRLLGLSSAVHRRAERGFRRYPPWPGCAGGSGRGPRAETVRGMAGSGPGAGDRVVRCRLSGRRGGSVGLVVSLRRGGQGAEISVAGVADAAPELRASRYRSASSSSTTAPVSDDTATMVRFPLLRGLPDPSGFSSSVPPRLSVHTAAVRAGLRTVGSPPGAGTKLTTPQAVRVRADATGRAGRPVASRSVNQEVGAWSAGWLSPRAPARRGSRTGGAPPPSMQETRFREQWLLLRSGFPRPVSTAFDSRS